MTIDITEVTELDCEFGICIATGSARAAGYRYAAWVGNQRDVRRNTQFSNESFQEALDAAVAFYKKRWDEEKARVSPIGQIPAQEEQAKTYEAATEKLDGLIQKQTEHAESGEVPGGVLSE
jgi:hypothetical protein